MWLRKKPDPTYFPAMHPLGKFPAKILDCSIGQTKLGTNYIRVKLNTGAGSIFGTLYAPARSTWEPKVRDWLKAGTRAIWDWNENDGRVIARRLAYATGLSLQVEVINKMDFEGHVWQDTKMIWEPA